MDLTAPTYRWGYDAHIEVIPKPAPIRLVWRIGPVSAKNWSEPVGDSRPARTYNSTPPPTERSLIVQLTADQQVTLSVTAEDAYGNPVDITGATAVWTSSDESIVVVEAEQDSLSATAAAVGPVGTAAVTVANSDGTVQGSLAIDVIAGEVAEITVNAGEPTDKP